MTATVKLFMQGRSQAVRLPEEFRFGGNEGRVSKVGNKVMLEPLACAEVEVTAVGAEIESLRKGEDLLPEGDFDELPAQAVRRKFFH